MAATEPVYILDACAVIALLYREEGSGEVAALLEEPENRCRIHALNLCEVFYDGLRRDSLLDAPRLEDLLSSSGIEIETKIPLSLWESAGKLKVALRISLADCFALALALQEKGTVVTSDHHELDRVAAAGICPIQFIR